MIWLRYLGLDLGTRTLGVSISDITHLVATTLTTLHFNDSDYDESINKLKPIIEENNIGKIVLGFPKNMNGTVGPRALLALEFKEKLEKAFNIEVVMQDERLTTKEAESYMLKADMSRKKRKQKIDSLAANIILQTYLDKERNEKHANG